MVETRVAAVVVGQDIVVVSRVGSAPDTSVAVLPLAVDGVAEPFRQDAPLEREIGHAVEAPAFVGRPAQRAMVYDDVLDVVAARVQVHRVVLRLAFISHPAVYETYDDVGRVYPESIVLEAYSLAGSGLSRDGDVTVSALDLQGGLELDDPGYVENYGPRTLGVEGCTEGTAARIVEVGHMDHLSAPSAGYEGSAAFSSRECPRNTVLFASRNLEFRILDLGYRRLRRHRRLFLAVCGSFQEGRILGVKVWRPNGLRTCKWCSW